MVSYFHILNLMRSKQFMSRQPARSEDLEAVLFRLCLSATVYNLWQERNHIRHGNHLQTEEKLIQKINWEVRMRILS